MKPKFTFTAVCLLIALPVLLIASKPPAVKWVVKNPLEQKVFVENKGQYAIPGKNVASQDILFGARVQGLEYYFTKTGIWINYEQPVKRTPQEIAQAQTQLKAQGFTVSDQRLQYKYVTEYHQMDFVGANPQVQITSDNMASGNFNFGVKNTSVTARGYKKITYNNLYPGIDMEVYFREDTTGFEYSFTVHPGADPSQIKIQYPLNEGLSLNGGNINVKAAYGTFTDHAPVANQVGTSAPVACLFGLNQGTVQFNIGDYNKNVDLKIDPWSVFTFTGFKVNNGFYVDFDDASNGYVYGGSYPWTLAKYDLNGSFLWNFTPSTTTDFPSASPYIANFGVDRITQSAYLIEGFDQNPGSHMVKLNGAGTEVAHYAGNANLIEMWRIAFSRCNPHQAVVGGGNIAGGGSYNSGFYLDTTLSTVTPVNVLKSASGYNDVCLLALDNATPQSNAYMGFCGETGPASNVVLQVPTPALTPAAWNKKDGYNFVTAGTVEVGSSINAVSLPNGYSGEAYGEGTDLFTYDGYILKKWNATTGAITTGVKVINTPSGDSSKITWAGLTSDLCDNIYVGAANTIVQYNGGLTKVATINSPATTDTVYDVKLGNYNLLYACGQNFLEAIQLDLPFCQVWNVDTATVAATCHAKGRASVDLTATPNPPYSYKWTPLGSTTVISDSAHADSLAEGFYVATITDSACIFEHIVDTIHVTRNAILPTVNISNESMCFGDSATLTATGTATLYTWSPSSTLSASSGAIVVARPATTTTYLLVGTEGSDCPDTVPVVVTVNQSPTLAILPNPAAVCSGNPIVLSANGAGVNGTYTWNPTSNLSTLTTSGDSVSVTGLLTATTYTVTGIDSDGCSDTASRVVNIGTLPVVSFTIAFPSPCNPLLAQFTTPFDSTITYRWEFGDSTSSSFAADPQHVFAHSNASDTIKLIEINLEGCIDSTDSVRKVESLTDVAIMPDAFTPSSKENAVNDQFYPIINCNTVTGYIFRIYNRWGEMVYESNTYVQGVGWDGLYNAKPEPIGVYVYYMQFNCGGCPVFRKGNVTLLR